MSDNPNIKEDNNKKQPKGNQAEKKNTDAWKEKQAMKKKQKEAKEGQQGQSVVEVAKEEKKEKKKKQKQPKQQQKQEQGKKSDEKPSKKQSQQQQQKQSLTPTYKKLQTVQTLVLPKHIQLIENRASQTQLIQQQVTKLIRPGDTVLYLGKQRLEGTAQLSPGSGRNNFRLVEVVGLTPSHPCSQIITRYEDLSYLIAESIDKIFLQASVIFQNGSALLPKGYQNILIFAKHSNKPVVLSSGSWNYSKVSVNSYCHLQKIYGEELTDKYDWVSNEDVDLVCMEFGAVRPEQVGYHVEQGYKSYGFVTAKW